MTTADIHIEHVSKRYGALAAVHDLSLDISYGAFVTPPAGNPRLHEIKLMAVDYAYIEPAAKTLKKRLSEMYQ